MSCGFEIFLENFPVLPSPSPETKPTQGAAGSAQAESDKDALGQVSKWW